MSEEEQKMSNGVNKTIIAVVVAVLVLASAYFLISRGRYQSTPSVSQPSSQQPIPQPPASESSAEPQQPSGQVAVAQTPTVEEKTIICTDSGYSPAVLKIKKGQTVIFKNQSSQSMWPAAAMHPTHRGYPTGGGCLGSTFDACSGIQPGRRWSFTFDIAGTWQYHNHLRARDTGTIVVE
ncbi:MAG: hypothetical protein AAB915_02035 [Patescibacteria group bacterium]